MTREQVMEQYNALPWVEKQLIRRHAADYLKASGFEEIGTSDISNAVYSLHNQYGDFESILEAETIDTLREYQSELQ